MKLYISIIFGLISVFALSNVAFAQNVNGQEDPRHNELRAVLVDLQQAINKKDIATVKSYLDPNVNVIYQNGEVADGVDAVEAFYKRMLTGDNPVLKDYSVEITVDKLSEFYGSNTAVSYGGTMDSISFLGGKKVTLPSRWTATLYKENGKWKIVSMQFGVNVFDNPLLSAAKTSVIYFSIGGVVLGLIVGLFVGKSMRKKRFA